MPFLRLKTFSSILSLLRVFIMNRCWILSSAFFHIYWDDHMGFPFSLLICGIIPIGFNMAFLWKSPPGHFVLLFFIYCWGLFANILLKNFWCTQQGYSSVVWVFFLQCLFLLLISGQCWPHKMSWEMFPPLLFSGSLYRIGIFSLLNIWWISALKPSGAGVSFLFFYKFIYFILFILFLAVLGLCCHAQAFLWLQRAGATLRCSA